MTPEQPDRPGTPAERTGPIRVVVADDQTLVRRGFATLIGLEADIEVVAEATDGAEAVRAARDLRPDVILMDIRMPGLDGLEATRQITGDPALADVRVLVLTTFDLDEYVFEALRLGASGFLVKHTDPDELVRAVRVVAAGEALLSPGVTRRLIHQFAQGPAAPPGRTAAATSDIARHLTEREREVVGLVAQGLSNEEIAEQWFVSQATVRTHVSRAMTKLYARDRAQLVVLAYQHGLATPPA
ncbi:response regulator transcription factor [Luteipulveratus sp. YIM 133132]|uniref:Response regulator transcription factor n=1 Tax=Luteipulveratus flavus TaxID=3031728 RepID=A0ABT6C4E7_9MICO|nr:MULTISPECIES: response regulator transcription factor [unclassified Luteipulveratus]MDE9367824.1 response regulator transcription factor [Luteipulveratus sp. YIM 133132]MDF8263752.1 response regulator transcription factor [Luteipulveratus sp. YIM 133296]